MTDTSTAQVILDDRKLRDVAASYKGSPQVGKQLVVKPVKASPKTAIVSATYEWTIDGVVVAAGDTYTPTAADAGKKLTLSVTATAPGYAPVTANSSAKKVKPAK